MNGRRIKNIFRVIICLVTALVMAFAIKCAGYAVWGGYGIKDMGRLLLRGETYSAADLTVSGYDMDGNAFTSNCEDAYFCLPILERAITNVVIEFDEPLERTLGVAVYYAQAGENFSEERVIYKDAVNGQTRLEIPVCRTVYQLRIDIGTSPGDRFCIKDVKTDSFLGLNKDIFYYWGVLSVIFLLFAFSDTGFAGKCYQKRYMIAAAVCVAAIALQLHGSSINYWGQLYGPSVYESMPENLFGEARDNRGDDWAASTSLALSQEYNDYGYFSDRIGIHAMDMFVVYGQPVHNPAVLFRPSHWGYLLFGSAGGLSYFWVVRAVWLFMVSWDFGVLVTNGRKRLAAVYGAGVLLSPVVQWWFGTNGFVEILLFGQLAVLLVRKYINTDRMGVRALLCTGICYCGCCYVLVFYPAWQIPFAYVFLAAAIWVLLEKGKFSFGKKDIAVWGCNLAVFGSAMALIFYHSREAVERTLHSVYPGSRFETGGGELKELLGSWTSLFFSHAANLTEGTNVCEKAAFWDLAPFGLILAVSILAVRVYKKEKQDKLLIILLVFSLCSMIWCTVGFPSWLCRITLLFAVPVFRGVIAFQYVQWLLLIRALSVRGNGFKWKIALPVSVFTAALVVIVNKELYAAYYSELMLWLLFGTALLCGMLCLCNISIQKEKAIDCAFMTCLVFGGLLVNPVAKGLGAIEDNQLLQEVGKEVQEQDELWAFVGGEPYMPTSLVTVGARTLNCIHVYPDMEMWRIIDPEGEYEEIYNRYQHITINVTKEKTKFRLLAADSIEVDMTPEDMAKMGIEKIVTPYDLEPFETDTVSFQQVRIVGIYRIYEICANF